MNGTPIATIVAIDPWLAAHRPGCCPDARCQCPEPSCVCIRHSHYRRCQPCASGRHVAARPRLVTATERAARAFGEWPPPPAPSSRLSHLLPTRPRLVDDR